MTDPVTNVEIEDVLSSIRRLVSENGRGGTRRSGTEPAADAPEEAVSDTPAKTETPRDRTEAKAPAAEDDMLVLTPALRVEEEAAGTGFASALQSAVRDALDDAVDEALGPASKDERDGPEAVSDEPAGLAEEAGESLKERIAELEAAVAEQDGEWEPDGDSEDAYAATPIETLAWEDHVEDEAQDMAAGSDSEWLSEVEEAEFVEAEDDEQIGAAPEPVFVHAADPEPEETPEAADELAEGMEAAGPVENDAPEDAPEEALDLFGAETTVIDEEMLREMVADIVRQELQGTLGERITRNVRKLVRREIHRALAAHELD